MKLELIRDLLCLQRGQLLKVQGGRGHSIVCDSGSVWVTQVGDRRDIVLGAGDAFALERNGLALVQALEQSAIRVAPPRRRSGAALRPAASARPGVAGRGAAFGLAP